MSLSLNITSYQRLTPGQQSTYHAESDSFTIGRNKENDWAIPDPQRFLSGVHCRIHEQGNDYLITDTSTNGVFLNGSEQRLTRNNPVALNPGDRLRIGDYEFEVLIDDASSAGNPLSSDNETLVGDDPFDDPYSAFAPIQDIDPVSDDPFSDDDPFFEPVPAESPTTTDDDFHKELNTPLAHLDNNPLRSMDSLMGFDVDEAAPDEPDSAENLGRRSTPLNEAFKPSGLGTIPAPPPANTGAGREGLDEFPDNWDEATGMFMIPEKNDPVSTVDPTQVPDDWDATTGLGEVPQPRPAVSKSPAPAPAPTPEPTPEPTPGKALPQSVADSSSATQFDNVMTAFAHGAGLNLNDIAGIDQNVLFEQVGRMLIMFTEGLIQTLGGRTHIKSEFRLDQTMIRPAENNPFKFSTSKTRTLLQLLSKSDPAYVTGVNAIQEGFDDVNAHQIAVMAGMEAALQDVLTRFSPTTLEKRVVSASILDNILPGGKKAKYWDIFKLLFDEIAGEAEDNFQQLFGREFSRAYEEQLSRLKNTRKE